MRELTRSTVGGGLTKRQNALCGPAVYD